MGNSKRDLHPSLYTIYNPNVLIKARKDALSTTEINVYHEILNHNHRDNPDQMMYKVAMDLVVDTGDSKNLSKNRNRIAEALMNRKFYLPQEFMEQYLGIKKERYLIPFPTIDFDLSDRKYFDVHLNPHFKKVLTLLDSGFTKGAIEDLRDFKSRASKVFYWIARQKQTFKNVWEVDLDTLKEEMDMEDQYPRWDNFRRRVIEVVYEELKGTFTEFEWEPIKKGKNIAKIKFIFRHGPKDIQDKPAGFVFDWEKDLLSWGVTPDIVKQIRQRVKVNQQSEEYGFVWSAEYVIHSLDGARLEYNKKLQNSRKQKAEKGKSNISMIKNPGGWIANGLRTGQWFSHVREKINEEISKKQKSLDFGNAYDEFSSLVSSENGKHVQVAEYEEVQVKKALPKRAKQVSFSDEDARDMYDESGPDVPFEAFMKNLGYRKEESNWVK